MSDTTTSPRPSVAPSSGVSRTMTVLFAVAGGAAVANTYWAQPILHDIAQATEVSTAAAGLLVTVSQVGYGLGVLLLVPLGDRFNARRLVPLVMVACAGALATAGVAATYPAMLVALALVGFTTVAGQLLIPLAADLARDDQRGSVVGSIVSGLLTGILVSRTISGVVADAFGWRAIFLVAAALTATLALLVRWFLPTTAVRTSTGCAALLRSVFALLRHQRVVQVTVMMGALNVGVFSLFWTALTFLLTSAPYSYTSSQVGLVGLAGLAGALTVRRAGRAHDAGRAVPATGATIGLATVALTVGILGSHALLAVLVAVLLLDIAVQAGNVLHQTRLVSGNAEARGRMNTAFVTCSLMGGAAGSALAGALWSAGGWGAVMTGGLVMCTVSLGLWALARRTLSATWSS